MVKTVCNNYRQLAPVLFGKGAINKTGDVAVELGCKKAMIVTDEGINGLGFPKKIEDSLKEKGIECIVWANAGGECPTPNLLEGASVAREFGADCTIGIGGGSCMGAAKVISVLANNDPDYVLPNFFKFLSFQEDYANPLLKTICIPTTAGTGSESTFVAVINNDATGTKVGLPSPPAYGIIDPELAVGSPARMTAWCGLDAFAHAVESLCNTNDSHHSDLFAYEAIRLITKWLPIACAHPNDYEAREQLAWAANLAGMSFSETNCNMGHAVAQAAGHLYHIPHGLACGSVCGGYMEFAAKDFPGVIRKIGVSMGLDCIDIPDSEIGVYVGRAHRRLMKQLNVINLTEFTGVKIEDALKPIVDEVMVEPLATFYRGFTGEWDRAELEAVATKMWTWQDIDD